MRLLPPALTYPSLYAVIAGMLVLVCLAFTPLMLKATISPGPGAFSNSAGATPAGDFAAFYAAGRLAATGDLPTAYDAPKLFATYPQFTSTPGDRPTPYAYPPPAAPLMAALSPFEAWTALHLWLAAAMITALAAAFMLVRRVAPTVIGAAFPGIGVTLSCGQTSLFAAPNFALALLWWRTRPLWAGIALGALIWKPHLALGAGLIALLTRQWRVVAGGVLGALGLTLLTLPFVGLEGWRAFFTAITTQAGLTADATLPLVRMPTAFATARTWGLDASAALLVHALYGIAGMWAVLRIWRAEELWARGLALVLSAALISPYIYDYDLGLLVLPFVLLVGQAIADPAQRTWRTLAWLALMAVAPATMVVVSILAKIPLGAVAVAGMLTLAVVGPLRLAPPRPRHPHGWEPVPA